MKEKIGIVGYGRMGHALAGRLIAYYDVFACDIREDIRGESIIKLVDAKSLFSLCRYILLCIHQKDMEYVVQENKSYCKSGTYLINIATDYPTRKLREMVDDILGIKVITAKIMGQYLAIEKGMPAVVVTDEIEEDKFSVVQSVFSRFATVIKGNTNVVKTINHEITKRVIYMLLETYCFCEKQGMTKEVYEIAVKAVATGTIEEFEQYTDNDYIKRILEEIRGDEKNEG